MLVSIKRDIKEFHYAAEPAQRMGLDINYQMKLIILKLILTSSKMSVDIILNV